MPRRQPLSFRTTSIPVRKFVIFLLMVIVLGAIGANTLWNTLNEPYRGFDTEEQFVEIPPGTSIAQMGRRLVDAGVVHDYFVFRVAVWRSGRSHLLKAGEYRFTGPATVSTVVDR